MIRSLMLTALILLATPAFSQPTILVMGDSLSAAYGIDERDGWVALLQQQLIENGLPYQVINASISGETTAGGLSRLPRLLQQNKAELLILALGANDGLRGLSLKQMRHNLNQMIIVAREGGSKILLIGMQLPPNYGKTYSERFFHSFMEIAKQNDTAYMPFLLDGIGEQKDLFQADGLHPTATAQTHIMKNIMKALSGLINQNAPAPNEIPSLQP